MRTWLHTFDLYYTILIRRLPFSYRFMRLVSHLGRPAIIMVVASGMIALGWSQANNSVINAGVAVLATLGVGSTLKLILHRRRPATPYAARLFKYSYSFPSGHSVGAAVAYGLLAYFAVLGLPLPWGLFVATNLLVLIGFVGISRVFLGAHFPSDVAAGWFLGGVGLGVIIAFILPWNTF